MRHIIVLPGNSLKNKGWGELMLAEYGPQFDSAYMLSYDHWESGEQNINFKNEETKLRAHVDTLSPGTEITIFAKSAGSLLAFLAISNNAVTPTRCVFFGIPFDLAAPDLFKDNWGPVDTYTIPTIAFHNIADPTTSFEFTKETIATHVTHITLIPTAESDHWYGDTTIYQSHLQNFLNF